MLAFAYYILKVIICSLVLYAYYYFFLRNKIYHNYNRFYLLATIVISLILPVFKFDIWHKEEADVTVVQMLQVVSSTNTYVDDIILQNNDQHISASQIIFYILLLITCIIFIFFIQNLVKIHSLRKNNPSLQYDDITLIQTTDKSTPFSYFKNIFWNTEIDINSVTGKRILKHEIAHVKEKHSYDKLFINSVLVLFWYNPVFFIIRKELSLIHEFLADKKAVEDGDTSAFAAMVLQAAYPTHHFHLTNNFFYSPIKRRIAMLSKNNKAKVTYLSRLLVLPLAAIIITAFSIRSNTPLSSLSESITVVIDAGHGGHDGGALSEGISEKELTLALAKEIKALNKDKNINIILTREEDIYMSPQQKANFTNNANADLFISIHVATDNNKSGSRSAMEIYVSRDTFKNSVSSKLFASAVIGQFSSDYPIKVEPNPLQRAVGIWVIQKPECPSVLIEAGYINNKKDREYLSSADGRKTFAEKILASINSFAVTSDFTENQGKAQNKIQSNKYAMSASEMKKSEKATELTEVEMILSKDSKTESNRQIPVVINGRLYKEKELYNKKLTAKRSFIYEKNNPEMIRQYGQVAKDGIIIMEDAKILELSKEDKYRQGLRASLNVKNDSLVDASQRNISINVQKGMPSYIKVGQGIVPAGTDPLYVINGKITETRDVIETDPNSILTVNILDQPGAIEKYGAAAKNGVVEIETKKAEPLYIVNGSIINTDDYRSLDPDEIKSVHVIKGDKAQKKYGVKGKNGVIEITTKKVSNAKPSVSELPPSR